MSQTVRLKLNPRNRTQLPSRLERLSFPSPGFPRQEVLSSESGACPMRQLSLEWRENRPTHELRDSHGGVRDRDGPAWTFCRGVVQRGTPVPRCKVAPICQEGSIAKAAMIWLLSSAVKRQGRPVRGRFPTPRVPRFRNGATGARPAGCNLTRFPIASTRSPSLASDHHLGISNRIGWRMPAGSHFAHPARFLLIACWSHLESFRYILRSLLPSLSLLILSRLEEQSA